MVDVCCFAFAISHIKCLARVFQKILWLYRYIVLKIWSASMPHHLSSLLLKSTTLQCLPMLISKQHLEDNSKVLARDQMEP